MRLKVLQTGDPVLRQVARPVTQDELASEAIQRLIEYMRETMRDAPGVGLAAPQVGIPLQLAVIEDREEFLKEISAEQLAERERKPVPFQVIVNPTIRETSMEQREFFEGCLSLAGFAALVPRTRSIRVECLDEKGEAKSIEASGWHARILQHEIDHLQGHLYIDRMLSRTFTSLENVNRFWKGLPTKEIKLALE